VLAESALNVLFSQSVDVLKLQAGEGHSTAARLNSMHKRVTQYDNSTEHLYSFLQVMTACTASFAHGSNDVANAVGAYAVIYDVWSNGRVAGKDTPVPVWILAYGGAMIVVGLATCTCSPRAL
jgi:sodium-dependent phosphate transporter